MHFLLFGVNLGRTVGEEGRQPALHTVPVPKGQAGMRAGVQTWRACGPRGTRVTSSLGPAPRTVPIATQDLRLVLQVSAQRVPLPDACVTVVAAA